MAQSALRLTLLPCGVVLTLAALLFFGSPSGAADSTGWSGYGGDESSRHSPLRQINRENVAQLRVAWTYHTGDIDAPNYSNSECAPLVVDGVIYLTSAFSRVIALDAATGREIWKHHPFEGVRWKPGAVNRGVAYWSDGTRKRIVLATYDGRLISLDARTGQPDAQFGAQGVANLRAGVERDLTGLRYGATSPPVIFENLAIVGFQVDEGPDPSAPGDIRAFDMRTGREVWRFHTVPRPGEFGHDTWEKDSWKNRGGANAWAGLSVDAKRGLVFAGLGSAAFDIYGGDRKGANLFANCVLALDARTGQRRWHYQTIRHDLWDYDLPFYPLLVSVRHQGRMKDAVAQITKTGFVFVLDRETGKPLFEVVERRVPASDLPGEEAWPTQPVPVKPPPFTPQTLTEAGLTNISKEAHDYALKRFKSLRAGSVFTPVGKGDTLIFPGLLGGANWSGAAFDPATGLLYVNSNNAPWIESLKDAAPEAGYAYERRTHTRFTDEQGYPAVKPPWGNLTALDLNRGAIAWQTTLGELPELTARGLPLTGTENFGGAIVTAGGLVFIGSTMDEKFRAFDKGNGKLLWEHKLPAGGYAAPATYSVNGRQYVVIAAGGGGRLKTKSGDAFVAFGLPEAKAMAAAHPNMYLNQAEINASKAKVRAGAEPWKTAYAQLLKDAQAALTAGPFSVTGNGGPESKHDYHTEKPYCGWKAVDGKDPDCRDGQSNPQVDRKDYTQAIGMGRAARDLGLAYAFTGEARYAERALQLIRVWCLEAETRMTPKYTAANSRIELSIILPGMFYGADLIYDYAGWKADEKRAFLAWVRQFAESAKTWSVANNFENWRINLVAAAGALLADAALSSYAFDRYKQIIPDQISQEGELIHELRRTGSLSYSLYALNAMTQTAELARRQGVDLYDYKTAGGRGLKLALDYHAGYCLAPDKWPLQQLNKLTAAGCAHYELAYAHWKQPAYLAALLKWGRPATEGRIMGPVSLTHALR